MGRFSSADDRNAVEAEGPYENRDLPVTLYEFLTRTRDAHGARPAISFQLFSGPNDRAETLTWNQLHAQVTQAANLLRSVGVGPGDVVAFLLPNTMETAVVLLGAMVAGIINPINPLLEPEQIGAILRETKAKVLVTLRAFPKTDIAQKANAAATLAPNVQTVLEIDLNRYLTFPKSFIVPAIRPKVPVTHKATVTAFNTAARRMPSDRLTFDDRREDRIAAYFHTGGTTGMPKVARHSYRGMIYNGWLGGTLLFDPTDVLICPLPLFHVFAAYPVLMSCIQSGAHMVLPTPAGYRGDGVFDNLWKLVERWKVTFIITVPTAVAALLQRPVNADVSSLRMAISGSAPLPIELYKRFEAATGVQIAEGYGLTEATCLVSCNPVDGLKKVGSVGLPLPYSNVRICHIDSSGEVIRDCAIDEVGEICVANPGVNPGGTYTEAEKNKSLFVEGRYLRTGDLGRMDGDGYLWITGRAKDLIIRGGHNIDPAMIEEAMLLHPAVAMAGAIGQPDAFAGELPCVYVELNKGANVTVDQLLEHAKTAVQERAAVPKHVEILGELPKTAVGKIFKPDLRKLAITRVLDGAVADTGVRVTGVVEDKKRGLVARLSRSGAADAAAAGRKLDEFTIPWEWAD